MFARRHFIQSVLSTCAILSFPALARAWPCDSRLPLLRESRNAVPIDEGDLLFEGTQIRIMGVGDGGCHAVEHMIDHHVSGVEYICVNTDAQALRHSRAHKTIQLGSSDHGTGGSPDVGQQAALQAEEEIRTAMAGTHLLFIIASLGEGTGTGAAPVVARFAQSMDIPSTVGVVTMPFESEGNGRFKKAGAGLTELEAQVGSLIVLPNEKLLEKMSHEVTEEEALGYVHDQIKDTVSGIADIINVQGHVGVDFEDVSTVLSEPGKAWTSTAVASGPDRARHAAEQALPSILSDGFDLSSATGVLVLISGAKGSLKLSDSKLAMNTVRAYASTDAHVIYGTIRDDSLNGNIRVTLVATGLPIGSKSGPSQFPVPEHEWVLAVT